MNPIQYPAKVLLFGEYSVIAGSEALALPIQQFGGSWDFSATANDSHHQLSLFLNYLRASVYNFSHFLNLDALQEELSRGIYLKSNIPYGYGLGSSGSVCAAVFDRFKLSTQPALPSNSLRALFSQMESFFHCNSSGLDPLVSYLNKPVIILPDQQISILDNCSGFHNGLDVYLFDSGRPRITEPLVLAFKEKLKDPEFEQSLSSELKPLIHTVIDRWVKEGDVFNLISEISKWQLKNMSYLIPESVLLVWKTLTKELNIVFKLCGAGGGGYFLVFAEKGSFVPETIKKGLIKISP